MATPDEAYAEGYKKGRKEGIVGNTAEAIFGLLQDDPGGHCAAGYRDGTGGREFKLPSSRAPVRKPAADVNPFDDKVAIKTVCPHCGALDWFEWKFLGRLTDPICGHSWYVGSGTYAAMQIRAAFAAGGKGAKYLTSGVSGGEGAWIAKGMGWFMGVLLGLGIRLEFGILMIPFQALAGLFGAKAASDIVTRLIVLAVTLGGLGLLIHEVPELSRRQFPAAGYIQTQTPQNVPASAPVSQNAASNPSGAGSSPLAPQGETPSGTALSETFGSAADFAENWLKVTDIGATTVTYQTGSLRLQAAQNPRSAIIVRKQKCLCRGCGCYL